LTQTINGVENNFTQDLNAGLTQVLNDKDNTYLYGLNRLGYENAEEEYQYLTDALGSVRQVVKTGGDNAGLKLTKSFAPYGDVIYSNGLETPYGFTGEMQSGGLVHLRARDYATADGRFLTRDSWEGDANLPISYNKWTYAIGNPIIQTDPSGLCSGNENVITNPDYACWQEIRLIEASYSNIDITSDNWKTAELESVKKALDGMAFTFSSKENFSLVFDKAITLNKANWFVSWIFGYEASSTVGLGNITIYDDAYKKSYDLGSAVIIHEFGHFLDPKYGNLSMGSFKNEFWSDCVPNIWNDDCSTYGHNPQCIDLPASTYGFRSPQEDFTDLFAWYVWSDNKWDVSVLYSEFMPPSQNRFDYMENLISKIKNNP
jgi:RHS repeat-associated protein